MNLYVNEEGKIRTRLSYPSYLNYTSSFIPAKRSSNLPLSIYFVDDANVVARKSAGSAINVVVKELGKFDSDPILSKQTIAYPATDADPYLIDLTVSSATIDNLLNKDTDLGNDALYTDLMLEISTSASGGGLSATDWVKSDTVLFRISNDVNRGNESGEAPNYGTVITTGIASTEDFTLTSSMDLESITIGTDVITINSSNDAPIANGININTGTGLATATESALALKEFINGEASTQAPVVFGTRTFSAAVSATVVAGVLTVTADSVGVLGNTIALAETAANGSWGGGATFLSGGADTVYATADDWVRHLPITSIHEAYATETNNVITGTIYKTDDFDQLLEKLDVIPHIQQSFNVSDAGNPLGWLSSDLAMRYVWDGNSFKGEDIGMAAEIIFNTDHWELRTMSTSNFNSPSCNVNDHPADVVGAWVVQGSATGTIADGTGVTLYEPRNWKHTSVSTREVFNALSPFTLTNTGGGNLQANDAIPKLWDWEAILTGSPSAPPEFYSGGAGVVALTTLVLGSKVTSIAASEFYGCINLVSHLVLPDGLTEIADKGTGSGSFASCTSLPALTCGSGLLSIGDGAFYGCTSMTTAKLNEGLLSIGIEAFKNCTSLTAIDLPSTLTSIGNNAFDGCTGVTSDLTIPASVTSCGNDSFQNMTIAGDIIVEAGITSWGALQTFYGTTADSITIGEGIILGGESTFQTANIGGALVLPDSMTTTGVYFASNAEFTSITTGAGLTSTADYLSLQNQLLLTADMSASSSLTSIGSYAFYGCTGLTSVILPAANCTVGTGVFKTCTALPTVTIPEGFTTIGVEMFRSCTALTGVHTIPDSVTSIGSYAYYYAGTISGDLEIVLGSGMATITSGAFAYCDAISLTTPAAVTALAATCANSMTKLTTLNLSEGLLTIGNSAFQYATVLASVIFPSTLTSIGASAFSGGLTTTHHHLNIDASAVNAVAFDNAAGTILYVHADHIASYGGVGTWNSNTVALWSDYPNAM